VGNMKKRGNLKELGVAGRMILKQILINMVGRT
jgi:hypothetical protein